MLRMSYPEVKKVNGTMYDACDNLKTLGYVYLDSGRYARVFAKDDHVVKIGFVNDDNYFNYVRMVGLQSANPHLPHIFSVDVFDMNPDTADSAPYYIVKMEKLRLDVEGFNAGYWNGLGMKHPGKLHQQTIESVEPKTSAMCEVKKILLQLYQCYNAQCDVARTGANVLWRGKTAVFTDPVI